MLLVPYFSADAAKEPTTQIKDQIIFYFILNLFLFYFLFTILFPFANETNLFPPVWVYFHRKQQLE